MRRRSPYGFGLVIAAATAMGLAACDTQADGPPDADGPTQDPAVSPDQRQGEQPQEIYEARLEGLNDRQITGVATVTVLDDELQVVVAATGLEADTQVPQHIHVNATCDDAGGILLNLDEDLSAANEAPPRGDAYPDVDGQGRLEYQANRSLDELRTAMGDAGAEGDTAAMGDAAAGQDAGAAALDLGSRVVNLHDEDMQPIACGALEQTGQAGGTPGGAAQPSDTRGP